MHLVQFTDTHLFGDARATLRGVDTRATLQHVLTRAAADVQAADAVLVTGDLVQDDPGGYAGFRAAFAPLGKPVWCLPGNHDLPDAMLASLRGPPFQVCGQIDHGAWRIVLLDSFLAGSAGGLLTDGELQRLDSALASSAGRHVLVCVHHQPVAMHSRWLDGVSLVNAPALLALIDRYPGVTRGILWGHVHQEFDGYRGDVRLMATPSTCTQFLPGADEFALDDRPPAYRRIRLLPHGAVESEVIWVS